MSSNAEVSCRIKGRKIIIEIGSKNIKVNADEADALLDQLPSLLDELRSAEEEDDEDDAA